MHPPETLNIFEAQSGDLIFNQILALWRPHSSTLGFMPEGGFKDAAKRKMLLAVINTRSEVKGYVLYRKSYGQIAIAHLCVSPSARGRGVARLLTEEVSRRHMDSSGIGLWCRRDFDANNIWQHLGFSAKAYRNGRGQEKKTLTLWFKDHGHKDLFSISATSQVEAVVDSCVLFDMLDGKESIESDESKALLADWLQDSILLHITPEVGNDIQRDNDPERREKRNSGRTIFNELRTDPNNVREAEQHFLDTLPPPSDDQTKSDYRHLAWTRATNIKYFITRDRNLQNLKDNISLGDVKVMSPGEFIRHVDELERSDAYRPEILFGTRLTLCDVTDQNIDSIELLADCERGEKPRSLSTKVRSLLSRPRENRVRLLKDSNGNPLSLIGEKDVTSRTPTITLLRLPKTMQSPTLAHFVAVRIVKDHASFPATELFIDDANVSDEVSVALVSAGFKNTSPGIFSRRCCRAVINLEDAKKMWPDLASEKSQQEHAIWPTKIEAVEDRPEAAYIIPIKPYYAGCLFDHELAGQTFFGSQNQDLLLQDESVYYSGTHITLKSPSRILWYVSQTDGYHGTSSIRACSFLQETVRGQAKELYKKFRRFGVFEWNDVLRTAGAPTNNITALRFSHTECFLNPIPFADLQSELKSAPAGPRPISNSFFLRLYKKGMNL